MRPVLAFIFLIIALAVGISTIGGCVDCEKSGGLYVKNVYGTYSCVKGK